jgi:hypothetical protein
VATTVYRWRVLTDSSPWKMRKGKVLPWAMTEEDGARWQRSNPDTVLERIEGSAEVRQDFDGRYRRPPNVETEAE